MKIRSISNNDMRYSVYNLVKWLNNIAFIVINIYFPFLIFKVIKLEVHPQVVRFIIKYSLNLKQINFNLL